MSLDVAQAAAILKKTYPDGIVEMDYKKSKTLALLKKTKGALVASPFGESFDVPIKHGNPQAGSAVYATGYAQANAEQSRYKKWLVTPATVFHFADVNGDITRRAAGTGGFVDAMTTEIENAKDALRRILEISLFKGGFGDLAQLSATANVASATGVALKNPWMVRFIETGMSLVSSATEGGGVTKSATAIKVVGRHAAAGTIDMAAAPNTQSMAVSDFLFRLDDRDPAASPVRRMPTGFKGWVPATAPSATLFNGVDRTVDDRLGGMRQDATLSGSIEEAFLDADALVEGEGGEVSHYVLGSDTFTKLAKSLTGKIEYTEQQIDVGIGISGFKMTGSGAMFYKDPAMEEGVSYGFNVDEVELRYAGKEFCYIEDKDGLTFRRVGGFDLWRTDLVSCCNLIIPAPGHCVNVFGL
jgi:hypothetical protein